jgi:hypothetical protein
VARLANAAPEPRIVRIEALRYEVDALDGIVVSHG